MTPGEKISTTKQLRQDIQWQNVSDAEITETQNIQRQNDVRFDSMDILGLFQNFHVTCTLLLFHGNNLDNEFILN